MSDPSRCNWGSGIERFVGVVEMGLARLIRDLHPAASAPFIQRQTVRDPKKSGTKLARKNHFHAKKSPVVRVVFQYTVVCSSTSEFLIFCTRGMSDFYARNIQNTQDSSQFLANPSCVSLFAFAKI